MNSKRAREEHGPEQFLDPVEEASEESFPASDAPSWTMGSEAHSQNIEVFDNPSQNRFEARIGRATAFLAYRRNLNEIALTHAETPPELEGRGIGSAVVRAALEFARQHQLIVIPLCPFVRWYLQQHHEYLDLVSPDYRAGLLKAT